MHHSNFNSITAFRLIHQSLQQSSVNTTLTIFQPEKLTSTLLQQIVVPHNITKIDDSFRKPGSVPFKWEIRPGVPKNPRTPRSPKQHQRKQLRQPGPTSGLISSPHPTLFGHPNIHVPTAFGLSGLARPDVVLPTECFPSPLMKTKNSGKKSGGPKSRPKYGYCSDTDIPFPWSISSRKSTDASPTSSSFDSYQLSPDPFVM